MGCPTWPSRCAGVDFQHKHIKACVVVRTGNAAAASSMDRAFTSSSSSHASSKPGSREPGFCCSSQSAFLRIFSLPISPILELIQGSRKRADSQRISTAIMSLRTDKTRIRCDGENCRATASLPVALHARLLPLHLRVATADGWLIISGSGPSQHFCPACASRQLECIVASDSKKQT